MKTKLSFFIIFLLFPVILSSQSFSLEDILGAPYASDLIASTAENRIAWVTNEKGVRNIWTDVSPGLNPVKITDYHDDDGQSLTQLIFSPDGKYLLFVRGGGPNNKGELPNPASDPKGVEQAIYITDMEGSPKKIADGSNPVVSPDGKQLVYSSGGQWFRIPLYPPKDSIPKPEKLFQIRGSITNLSWSQDGSMILFVSYRNDHSFIGIYHENDQHIQWIDPGVDYDLNPVWSPDGKQVAYLRRPGNKKDELYNLMGAYPFTIRIFNLENQEVKEIWQSPGNDGGFAQYYPAEPLRWTKNDRILFYSEHEEWMHIYSISPDGKDLTDLTPGACEAEHSSVSPDGKTLYYSCNCGDIDRRHIWKSSTDLGNPSQLTEGNGIETDPVAPGSGSYIAFRSGTYNNPTNISTLELDSKKWKIISPENLPVHFPSRELVEPKPVAFTASDGIMVHAQLFVSGEIKSEKQKPAVIFMHGGPIRQMLLGWHYRGYYANAYAFNQYLANQGYIVLSVNYRCGIGYGRAFRLAEATGPRGASEYQDIVAAAHYLQSQPEVDPEKIGLWGGSYGGYLTAMGLAKNPELFAAGVDLHGVHDWSWRATDFSRGGSWGIGDEDMDLAYQSSPTAYTDQWTSPVLFIHGDDDRNVMFSQTTDMVQKLRERNVHAEVLVFPDEVHGFLRYENWLKAYKAAVDFFNRFLK